MASAPDPDEEWLEELRRMRAEKDSFFAEHRQSPIPPDERDAFDGLSYFDPDERFFVEATVERHEDPETVELDTSDGRTIEYQRVLTFQFELDGEPYSLHGYKQDADSETIFVPVLDRTSGDETYEDGRYMELEPERDLETGDQVTIDFNLAYSPFCAYSETFSCPLPPAENHLEVAIEAGEKVR